MRFLLLLIAAVIAIFAGIAAMQLSSPAPKQTAAATPAPSANVATIDILVAKAPIAAGTQITAAMLDKQPWPENLVLDGFIVNNGPNANIIGKVLRSPLQAREPVITSKLASTSDTGFLAANLPKGTRAITIATDAISGVAGFVFPGDRIDLVFTHNVPADIRAAAAPNPTVPGVAPAAGGADKPSFAEMLASNVPVLAVNLREGANENTPGGMAGAVQNATNTTAPSSMTLQVTDMQAEKIRLAEKVGGLSVALRSINDRDNKVITTPADLMSLTQLSTENTPAAAAPVPHEDTVRVIRNGDFGGEPGMRMQGGR